jgi:hypothetical protein
LTIDHVIVIPASAPCRLPNTTFNPNATYVRRLWITIHQKNAPLASPIVWQIELHNGVDNRLVKSLINDAFKPALQIVEREWRKERAEGRAKQDKNAGTAALVIVGRLDQEKFFSNGAPDLPRF